MRGARCWRAAIGMVAALTVGLAVGAGCSSDDGSPPVTTSSGAPQTSGTLGTSSAPPTPEDEVREAYLAYWRMVDRVAAAPDPDDPELAQRATGLALSGLVTFLSESAAAGTREILPSTEADYSHTVRSVSVEGAGASIVDCFVDGRVRVSTSGVIDDEVLTRQVEATLVLSDVGWLVQRVVFASSVQGRSACAG